MSKDINDIKNEELRSALWELTNPDIAVGFDMQHHFDLLLDACLKAEKYDKLKLENEVLKESLKESVDEKNEIISELKEANKKLNNKIIDLSAELGMFQNENLSLTKDIEKYWSIEQQLNLSLEVFSKVLLDWGINDKKGGCQITGIAINGDGALSWIVVNGDIYDFKDYKKTWWLKGEKMTKKIRDCKFYEIIENRYDERIQPFIWLLQSQMYLNTKTPYFEQFPMEDFYEKWIKPCIKDEILDLEIYV